jgi:hypothetical protein
MNKTIGKRIRRLEHRWGPTEGALLIALLLKDGTILGKYTDVFDREVGIIFADKGELNAWLNDKPKMHLWLDGPLSGEYLDYALKHKFQCCVGLKYGPKEFKQRIN